MLKKKLTDLSESKKGHAAKKRSFNANGDFDAYMAERRIEWRETKNDEFKTKNPRFMS